MINLPSYFDPFATGGREHMLSRYNYVIDGMRKSGAIRQDDADRYHDHLPAFSKRHVSQRYGGPNGFVLKMVENEMSDLEFSPTEVNGNGLHIVTTISYKAQHAAFDAFNTVAPKISSLNHALVSIEPGKGAVRALYGGPDYLKSELNWATLPTQPGSTFKIFGVVAALKEGFSLKTVLNGNSPMRMPDGSTVENEDEGTVHGRSFHSLPLTAATANSVNTAFLDLERQLGGGSNTYGSYTEGATKVLDVAKALGLTERSLADYEAKKPPVTILGYSGVGPIEMANAYATITAGGKYAPWYLVEKVTSRRGEVLHQHEVTTEQVIPEDVAGDTLVDMQGVVKNGTGVNAKTICPTAGKTGTATHGAGASQHVSSSWFIGSTPHLTTAVMYNRGVGNESLQQILPGAYFGANYPSKTFRAMMNKTLAGSQCGAFPAPGNIKATQGKTAEDCPKGYALKDDLCVLKEPVPEVCPDGYVLNPDAKVCEPIEPSTPPCDGLPGPPGTECPSPTPTGSPSPPDYSQMHSLKECTKAHGVWHTGVDGIGAYCSAPA
jgi:membrane peptidoglycan carboxypeptidase